MPEPDVVAELALPRGFDCPPASQLQFLADPFTAAISVPAPLSPRTLVVCAPRPSLSANVVSVGLWLKPEGATDAELRASLANHRLLTEGNTAAFLATADGIRTIAEATYAQVDKTPGRVKLDDEIEITFQSTGITAVVTGSYDLPALPNPDFTATLTAAMTLRGAGATPPIDVVQSTHVEVSAAAKVVLAALASTAGWVTGVTAFFAIDPIASAQAPDIAFISLPWPSQILTPIRPPLQGRLALTWTDLTIDDDGILTVGTFENVPRRPRVRVSGPAAVQVTEALGHKKADYSAEITDLRAPLTARWTGGGQGSSASALKRSITFSPSSAGRVTIGATVRDVDGLEASDDIAVAVSVKRLEQGQRPH